MPKARAAGVCELCVLNLELYSTMTVAVHLGTKDADHEWQIVDIVILSKTCWGNSRGMGSAISGFARPPMTTLTSWCARNIP